MYKVILTTPRGVLEFNVEKLQEIEKYLLENSDYIEIKAEKVKIKEKKC